MGYIMDLRKIVGRRPIMISGAGVIVEDGEGRVLLQRRTDNHCWGYAGGCMELDETVEEAARRELREETGLNAGELEWFGVFSGPEMHYVYPNGDEAAIVEHCYLCRDWLGELKGQAEEVEGLEFFRWDALPENISPPNRPALNAWAEKKRREQRHE